ncbi:hypothetical protein PHSY_006898 [Pseudozyma hubeiensis SY62]|uniref:Rab-GAP TBC domain-containing protein n=1 Tax=Pseudozyma hubeiensis (strain SY62) TaxID=1305764 RepID=R9PDI5_PSEHS|nr:hypothetical protein PHSY_006898 [Pseudozyma hubeiensis SY62]GAC99297.1 hypothetical protein PHSY_006898 [Pseudozyma hubeiensis SY62]
MSRKTSSTSSTEDAASVGAREWKKLFQQIQSGAPPTRSSHRSLAAGDTSRGRGRGGKASRGGHRHPSQPQRYDSSSLLPLIPTSSSDPLSRIRHQILTTPLPHDTVLSPTSTSYRSIVWKLLLNISDLDIASYLSLVAKGKSPSHEKIRNDTFRTLATDQGFKERVKEEKLIRLLDAFVWKYHRGNDDDELLDSCLEILDPPLYTHLRSKNLSAEIYAFPSVMTLCACTPPLPEVLQLWDFLLAFGVHYNVLCIVAQLHIIRQDLLDSQSPMKLLRNLPPLDARKIINVTVTLARDIPQDLFVQLVKHPYHPDSVVGFT